MKLLMTLPQLPGLWAGVQAAHSTAPQCTLACDVDGAAWSCTAYSALILPTWFQSPFPPNFILQSSNQGLLSESS